MTSRLSRAGGRPLVGLLLFALVFKLVVLAATLDGDPLAHHATSDVRYYLDQARGGAGAARASEPFHMPPLYPLLLSALPGGTTDPSTSVLLLQVLAGVFGLWLTWVAAARRVGPRLALIAPALCLAYAPLSFFETKRLGDSLAAVLLLGVVLLAERLPRAAGRDTESRTKQRRDGDARPGAPRDDARAADTRGLLTRAAATGALLALAALLRPQALLLVPLLVLWSWRAAGHRAALTLLACAALVLLPSTLHNLRAGAGLVPVSDNGPINLWLAHDGPPSGTFATSRPEFGSIHTQAQVAKRAAEQARGETLSWREVSAHWRGEALGAIFGRPLDTLQRVGLRAAALVESFQTGVVAVPEIERRLIPPLRLAALPFGVLLGLAAGLWVATHTRSRAAARATNETDDAARPDSSSDTPAWLLAATVVASTLLFFHYERFRLPLVPWLAVATAVGCARWHARSPRVTRKALGVLVALLVAAQSFVPRSHHAHVRANGWSSVAEARLAQLRPGDREGLALVDAEFAAALDADPRYPRALLGHTKTALLAGDRAEAARRLARAEQVVPGWDELAALRRMLEGG